MYEAPITQPTGSVGKYYVWDESAYQADNSTGWFLLPD